MGKILYGIFAVLASVVLAESLTCNQCNYGLASYCLSNTEASCTTNTSVCATTQLSFTALSKVGFFRLACSESSSCNGTTNGSLVLSYEKKITCCSTDKCNTVLLSGAPTTRMTLAAGVAVVLLASAWSVM